VPAAAADMNTDKTRTHTRHSQSYTYHSEQTLTVLKHSYSRALTDEWLCAHKDSNSENVLDFLCFIFCIVVFRA